MFFKNVRRNAARNRKNNGLFFGSLVVAIVAFYTLLSLKDQDVMRFLKTIESDAVSKLMTLIPIVYIVSLFFVFFLVYFAYNYQLDNRKKEFGLYLMFGMKRSTFFALLMSETIWNSLISILIGLPIALLLTEAISLTTIKLVGIGIIGHRVSFSIPAVLGTVIGFIAVQMLAMLILSYLYSRKEPMELLKSDSSEKQMSLSRKKGWFCFVIACLFLVLAYILGVTTLGSFEFKFVMLIIFLGVSGTFLLYRGMGVFIGNRIRCKSSTKAGLYTFTGRQLQENVVHQYKTLAISCLLFVMSLSCVSFGIGVASGIGSMENRTVDFSIDGSEEEVGQVLDLQENKSMISAYYPMYISLMNTNKFSWAGLNDSLKKLPVTDLGNNMIEDFSYQYAPYLISESSYNELLQSIGKEQIQLEKNQVALYSTVRDNGDFTNILESALKLDAYIEVNDQKYELLQNVYKENVVADRKITLTSALIVSDEKYQIWASDSSDPLCWNVILNQEIVNEKGIMQAILLMKENLTGTSLEYESYIAGLGRNLFYTVAASYLTIYLGVLFMVIANTSIGLKYLMQERANKHRYVTLLMLGADVKDLCNSAKMQIRMFFALVIGVATCSSIFAICSMFTSLLKLPAGTSIKKISIITFISAILFLVIEYIYIRIVEQTSSREIQALRITDRSDIS